MRFRALDGFRGLCALIVALYHFPVENHVLGHRFFLPHAQMLLDFFFVMSGFLIAGAYGERLKTWGDVGAFAKSRFARLWPLHIAMLTVFVAIEATKALLLPHIGAEPPFSGAKAVPAIFTNVLLIHSLHLHPMLTWNAPSWTVSVEFFTYLTLAALVVTWPKRPLATALCMALVGALGVGLIARKLDANYDYGLFRCFYGFFCGALTWRVFKAAPLVLAERRALATALEAAALVGVFAYMAVLGGAPFGFAGPLAFSLFIWLYAAEQGAVAQFLGWGPLVKLGAISYSIYLVHYPIIVITALALRLWEHVTRISLTTFGYTGLDQMLFVSGPSKWLLDGVMLVYLAVVIAVATQTYKFIEVPGRDVINATTFADWPRSWAAGLSALRERVKLSKTGRRLA
jgi:peptidoglycan/LPS O-acetylase OafA/YrhL